MFFYRNPLKWVQDQKLIANDPDGSPEGDSFGYSMTLTKDEELLFIGSSLDEENGTSAGSVYIFQSSSLGYQQIQKLTASGDDDPANDRFGVLDISVNDNNETLAIGAYGDEENGGDRAGSVYIFNSGSQGYQQVQKLTASGDADPAGDWFGRSVSMNSTGDTIVIGAHRDEENGGTNAGSVYIFQSSSIGYQQVQKLTASGADIDPAGDYFGDSLSISGDAQIIAVGAFFDQEMSSGRSGDGAVYIFESGSSGYSQVQKIEGYGRIYAGPDSQFGYRLRMTSDGQKLVVAARYDDLPEQEKIGTVSVFRRTGNQYVLEQKLGGNYNNVIQNISGISINSDASVIVARSTQYETGFADYTDHGSPYEGAVFVFQSGSNGYNLNETITKNTPMGASRLTQYVGVDVNQEGTTLMFGQAEAEEHQAEEEFGAVYIFKLTRDY